MYPFRFLVPFKGAMTIGGTAARGSGSHSPAGAIAVAPAGRSAGSALGQALDPPLMLGEGGKDLDIQQAPFHRQAVADVPEAAAESVAAAERPRAEAALTQAAATPVWAAVVADAGRIDGRYLEDCAAAPIDDNPSPFADGVRSYALDPARARQLWARSEELIGAAS